MRRIYIASLYRSEVPTVGNLDGENLFVVDWDTKRILSTGSLDNWKSLSEEGEADPHPVKGLSRSYGARGLAWFQDHLWVAGSTHGLFKIDPDTYKVVGTFENEEGTSFLGPHQIRVRGDFLYIVNTGRDSLIKFDGQQVVEEIEIKDLPGVPELIEPLLEDQYKDVPWGEDKLHFNSINWDGEGNEYHTYMRCSAIFDVTNLRVMAKELSCPHDIEIDGPFFFYSSSASREVLSTDLRHKVPADHKKRWLKREIPKEELEARERYEGETEFPFISFTRGIALTSDGEQMFVGAAPGSLICVSRSPGNFGSVVGEMKYCNSRAEQPFDILLDPRDW